DSMLKRSSAFCRSPVSLRISVNMPGSRMWTIWSTAAKKAVSSSVRRASASASTQAPYSSFSMAKLDMVSSLARPEDLVELLFQRLRGEGLDHIPVHPCLSRLDDLLALGFCGQHQHRHLRQLGVGAHGLDQVEARHARHIPVGDEEVEVACLQHRQRRLAVVGFRDVRIAQIVQQVLDDV